MTIPKTLCICLLFCFSNAQAQDLHFSQFNENASLINPALTGVSSVLRASVVYRDQWRSVTVPYKTYGVSVESRFKATNWNKVEGKSMTFTKSTFSRFAAGLFCYTDKAGDANMGFTKVGLSLSAFVPISENSKLSLGLQGSWVQHKIDFSKLVFSTQYNGTGYDSHILSGENATSQTFSYFDFSSGLNWSYSTKDNSIISNNQKKANIGIAFFHMNQPKQLYLVEKNSNLSFKSIIHGDFLFGVPNTNIGIAPSYLFQFQGSSKELIAGALIKYYIKDDSKYTGIILKSSVNFGVFYRYRDAVIISFSFDKRQKYAIGFSYDLNISGLSKVTKINGGPEITLKYNTGNAYLYQKKPKQD